MSSTDHLEQDRHPRRPEGQKETTNGPVQLHPTYPSIDLSPTKRLKKESSVEADQKNTLKAALDAANEHASAARDAESASREELRAVRDEAKLLGEGATKARKEIEVLRDEVKVIRKEFVLSPLESVTTLKAQG